MKKKPIMPFKSGYSSNYPDFSTEESKKIKNTAMPVPPTEEILMRLNAIVKQAPFCFYYRERLNDSL